MTVRTMFLSVCLFAFTQPAFAQPSDQPAPAAVPAQTPRTGGAPAATPTPQPTPPAAAPRPREGQAINIKVDVTITDQRGATPALKKTVTVVTADGMSSFIRSQASYAALGEVPLNIDAEPFLLQDGKVRLRVNLQYDLPGAQTTTGGSEPIGAGSLRRTAIHENLAVILETGKPLVIAQSADPVGDRQVTIEVKATILR
jgi:hypothetical protein